MNAMEEMKLEHLKEENRRIKQQVAEYHRLKAAFPAIVREVAEEIEEER